LIIGAAIGSAVLGTDESRVKFLSGIGAIVLTFLAGAELDPVVFRLKWKEAAAVGLASFFFPFLACAAAAHYLLGWEIMPSWLAGVAMSTTSVGGRLCGHDRVRFQHHRLRQDRSRRLLHY
jgi:glutathione-regulated potassium-efflux system ancillary protein KefC